ncbi:hypothetical protein [Amycolatopsis japonica]
MLVWSNRRTLEEYVREGLNGLLLDGFPIPDVTKTSPWGTLRLTGLYCYIEAATTRSPSEALEFAVNEAIELADIRNSDHLMNPAKYPRVPATTGRIIATKKALGLHPDTYGLDSIERQNQAIIECFGKLDVYFGGQNHMVVPRKFIQNELFPPIIPLLCTGMPDRSPSLPSLDDLKKALSKVLTKGLPLTPDSATSDLLAFLPVSGSSESELMRVKRMDDHLGAQLEIFDWSDMAHAARIYFGAAPGSRGTSVTARQQKIAAIYRKDGESGSTDTIRTEFRRKMLGVLAWQLYRVKLAEYS